MKFAFVIYNDPAVVDGLPGAQYDGMMRECFAHVDELQQQGRFVESRMLADPATAKSVRIRNGRVTTVDGPYAEAKEVLGGFNIIEARDLEEALEIASHFPWAQTGCVEVRPVMEIADVRRQVGAPDAPRGEAAATG